MCCVITVLILPKLSWLMSVSCHPYLLNCIKARFVTTLLTFKNRNFLETGWNRSNLEYFLPWPTFTIYKLFFLMQTLQMQFSIRELT